MAYFRTKTKIIIAIIFAVIFFGVNFLLYFHYQEVLTDMAFKGTIEGINYDEKNIPDITVNNKRYHLRTFRKEFKKRVAIGDKIEKRRGAHLFTIIKKDSQEVLNFEF